MTPSSEVPVFAGEGRCEHCRSPIPAGAESARFCCSGCETVHSLLKEGGLDRYYALAGQDVTPATTATGPRSHTWLDAMLATHVPPPAGELTSLELDVQGVHCAACVWLMNELFRRRSQQGGDVVVNPTLGTVKLRWLPGAFDVREWVLEVERFGYQFGPPRKEKRKPGVDLPLRLGISAALTLNVMLFSVSFHFGLSQKDSEVFALFTWLSAVLSTATVIIGGWPFFRSAWLSVRSRVLHLDLPIALGIGLVYATSIVQLLTSGGRGDLSYFDTLNTFITLMLLGRFLQERVLQRNRRFLLDDDGAEGLVVRVLIDDKTALIPVAKLKVDDVLLVAPGDVVPTDAELLGAEAVISTDWINGEAAPRRITRTARIEAGSFNAGRSALMAKSTQDFADSQLVGLLRQPPPRSDRPTAKHQQLWNAVSKRWVVTVLGVSTLGFFAWLPFAGPQQALNVAVALLVITCPCAVGIAIPLAYELMQSRLRRAGFYSRAPDVLDRLTDVKKLVFDKTGTLTMGRLELVNPEVVELLSPDAREVAWNLAVRSSHPVSVAISRAFEGAKWRADADVVEVAGKGVEWTRADGVWRLGRGDWASNGEQHEGTLLTHNGVALSTLTTREVMRGDAKAELERLSNRGYQLSLLSGDSMARAQRLAGVLGIPLSRAQGALSPEQKAEEVRALGADDILFLGDGVNDALAFQAAMVAGTPAIDRPVMPSKSDFFLVGEGLSSLSIALDGANELRRVVRRILALSLGYNVLAITVALFGFMSPVAAAISMPASTLTLLAFTVTALGRPRRTSVETPRGWLPHPA